AALASGRASPRLNSNGVASFSRRWREAAMLGGTGKRGTILRSFGLSASSRKVCPAARFLVQRGAQRGQEATRLRQRFVEFGFGHAVGHDAGAGVEINRFGPADGGADGNIELALAVESKIADATSVGAPRHRFEFVDDFHRADLRRASNAAARKTLGESLKMRHPCAQAPFHG